MSSDKDLFWYPEEALFLISCRVSAVRKEEDDLPLAGKIVLYVNYTLVFPQNFVGTEKPTLSHWKSREDFSTRKVIFSSEFL